MTLATMKTDDFGDFDYFGDFDDFYIEGDKQNLTQC